MPPRCVRERIRHAGCLRSTWTSFAPTAAGSSHRRSSPRQPARGPGGGRVSRRRNRPRPPRPSPPRIRFGVIGLNHGHIYGQVAATIAGGGELVLYFADEPDLASEFAKRYPQAKLARSAREDAGRSVAQADRERVDSERARPARHPGHAARQGLHGRQAGHDDAGAAGGSAARAGGDEADLLDPVQRTAREQGDRQRPASS